MIISECASPLFKQLKYWCNTSSYCSEFIGDKTAFAGTLLLYFSSYDTGRELFPCTFHDDDR
jgi:hypothetical protein